VSVLQSVEQLPYVLSEVTRRTAAPAVGVRLVRTPLGYYATACAIITVKRAGIKIFDGARTTRLANDWIGKHHD